MMAPRPTDQLPTLPGTYALVLHLADDAFIEVGKLGRALFRSGFYVYVGSALGPGGLAGRLRRHARPTHTPEWRDRWHIDYLRHYAKVVEVWAVPGEQRREHGWASICGQLPGMTAAMAGFGSSDCGCPTHLFTGSHRPRPIDFRRALSLVCPTDELGVLGLDDL